MIANREEKTARENKTIACKKHSTESNHHTYPIKTDSTMLTRDCTRIIQKKRSKIGNVTKFFEVTY